MFWLARTKYHLTQYYQPNQSSSAESPEFSFGRILKLLKMTDHRYINSKNDPALFKWPQGGLKLGQDSEVIPRNVHVLLFVDRSSIYSFVPCLMYVHYSYVDFTYASYTP